MTKEGSCSKAQLDNIIAQAKLVVSQTSKPWEPYRAYEKKLATAISKEKGGFIPSPREHDVETASIGSGGRGRGRRRKDASKSAEFITTDEEAEEASEADELITNGKTTQNGAASDGEGGATEDENEAPAAATTPKARPKPRPASRKQASPPKSLSNSPSRSATPATPRSSRSLSRLSSIHESEHSEHEADEHEAAKTPKAKASRKRGRSHEDSDEEMPDVTTNGVEHEDAAGTEGEGGAETSQDSALQIRRKRARR